MLRRSAALVLAATVIVGLIILAGLISSRATLAFNLHNLIPCQIVLEPLLGYP
ncbi:MAG TPA: hypothetical protein GX693_01235 [Firmicutes bacterium]|nr:hypothetical protein [Bacillota bacterium]